MHSIAETEATRRRPRFVQRYLDPASRLGEVLFGLIMVLTVTLAAGLAVPHDRAGVQELLIAAIGCNVAWGIIDAVLFLMNCITVRAGKARLVEAVRQAPNEDAALDLIQANVEPELQELLPADETRAFSQSVLKHIKRARVRPTLLMKEDLYGAFACFWLVFIACLPAAMPFMVISDLRVALRTSNLFLIGLLFFAGYKWAQYAGTKPLRAGMAMVAIGLILVGIAIMLGG